MKLSDRAWAQGVHPKTAYRWWRQGTLPVPARQVNARVILVDAPAADRAGGVGLYARVSSHGQRADLDRQVARLAAWASGTGLPLVRTEAEVGSGMSGRRPKLRRLLADPAVATVVVTYRDRLGRSNTELVEVLTEFCSRLYGRRSARNRARTALRCAREYELSGQIAGDVDG